MATNDQNSFESPHDFICQDLLAKRRNLVTKTNMEKALNMIIS